MQDKLERPADQLERHDDQGAERQEERESDARLDDHQPAREEPLADHVVLPAEDVVAPVEGGRELVVGVPEVLKAILPQAHVLKAAERLLVGRDPVRCAEGHQQEQGPDVGQDRSQDQGTWNAEQGTGN